MIVDGEQLSLTPPYNICLQSRTDGNADHGMLIFENSNKSTIESYLKATATFHVKSDNAMEIITQQITVINDSFDALCSEVELTPKGRRIL